MAEGDDITRLTASRRPPANARPMTRNDGKSLAGSLPAADGRHHHLLAPAGAAIDFLAGAELEVLVHADPHFAEPRAVAGDRNRGVGETGIDLDEGVLDVRRRDGLRI